MVLKVEKIKMKLIWCIFYSTQKSQWVCSKNLSDNKKTGAYKIEEEQQGNKIQGAHHKLFCFAYSVLKVEAV